MQASPSGVGGTCTWACAHAANTSERRTAIPHPFLVMRPRIAQPEPTRRPKGDDVPIFPGMEPQAPSANREGSAAERVPFSEDFRRLACAASNSLGSHWAFIGAVVIVAGWAATGPFFHFSETWQLVINTGTAIVTFLMVFLIQSTQNRDAKAIHLKLD